MTSFPTPLSPAKEVIITFDPAFMKQVINWLITSTIPFRVNFTFPSKEDPVLSHPKEDSVPSHRASSEPLPETVKDKQADLWKKTPQFIVEMIKKGNPLSIEQMALRVKLTPHTFKIKFASYYGKPFYRYYLEKRMEYASELLQRGYKGNEVAVKIGYGEKSVIKFNKIFQKHFGMTPKKYQMQKTLKISEDFQG